MKKILAIVMVAIIAVMCTACGGLDMKKVKGEWTLSTINGMTCAEYAASLGVDTAMAAANWTLTEDSLVATNYNGKTTYKINVKSNGFEMVGDGANVGVIYDEKADTFSITAMAGDVTMKYVYVRGTTSLTPAAPAEDGGDASVDNGGEDYVDEGGDYADDGGYAEDGGEDYAEDGYEEE